MELRRLLEAILADETAFREQRGVMNHDEAEMEQLHERMRLLPSADTRHAQLRDVHDAMFKVHRKLLREVHRTTDYCRQLLVRLNQGHLSDPELKRELAGALVARESLHQKLDRVEQERKQIVAEHRACFGAPANGATMK